MSSLQKKVLVLNKNWMAVGVVSLRRAIIMLFSEYANGEPKAKVVETEETFDATSRFQTMTWSDWAKLRPRAEDLFVNGCSCVFRVPKVILLHKYDKLPMQKVHYNRRTLYRRDNNTCQYCGKKMPTEELTVDHVIPKSRGGKSTWDNTVVACVDCNSAKADRTPEEARMKLFKKPHKPSHRLYQGDIRVKDWEAFLGEAYWLTEMPNDNE